MLHIAVPAFLGRCTHMMGFECLDDQGMAIRDAVLRCKSVNFEGVVLSVADGVPWGRTASRVVVGVASAKGDTGMEGKRIAQ